MFAADQYCPGDFEENFDDEDDDDGRCKLPCPIPIYSDGEYLAMKSTFYIPFGDCGS